MMRVLVWKEYREQRAVWLALSALTVLTLVGVAQLEQRSVEEYVSRLLVTSSLLICVGGIVYGSILFAGGGRNLRFRFARCRQQIWATKALTGWRWCRTSRRCHRSQRPVEQVCRWSLCQQRVHGCNLWLDWFKLGMLFSASNLSKRSPPSCYPFENSSRLGITGGLAVVAAQL